MHSTGLSGPEQVPRPQAPHVSSTVSGHLPRPCPGPRQPGVPSQPRRLTKADARCTETRGGSLRLSTPLSPRSCPCPRPGPRREKACPGQLALHSGWTPQRPRSPGPEDRGLAWETDALPWAGSAWTPARPTLGAATLGLAGHAEQTFFTQPCLWWAVLPGVWDICRKSGTACGTPQPSRVRPAAAD